jgi:hypothetical protein
MAHTMAPMLRASQNILLSVVRALFSGYPRLPFQYVSKA